MLSAWLSSLNPQHSFVLQASSFEPAAYFLPLFLFNTASGDSKRVPHPTVFSILHFLGLSQSLSQLFTFWSPYPMSSTSLALPVLNSLKEQRLSSKRDSSDLVTRDLSLEYLFQDSLSPPFAAGDARWSQSSRGKTKGEPNSPLGKGRSSYS